jgi:hypothetical protein
MGRAWNGNLLGFMSDGEGQLIIPRRGAVIAVFRARGLTPSTRNRVEDLASADLQVLLGQSDAAPFLLQPASVRVEAVLL